MGEDMSTEVEVPVDSAAAAAPQGMRKNGKQWHEPKTAFRPKAGNGTYEKRQAERVAMAAVKADEKEAARKVKIQAIKDKRVKKEEKARFEKLAETMHRKRVERLKRKEKRNKMSKS